MKNISVDLCKDVIFANCKGISKEFYLLDALEKTIVIPENKEEFYYEIKGCCIDSINSLIRGNTEVFFRVCESIEEKDNEIEKLTEEVEKLKSKLAEVCDKENILKETIDKKD